MPDIPDFTWSPDYAIGIAELDAQHQHLFTLLERLNQLDHSRGWRGESRLRVLLEEFSEYATFHFLTEEALMREHLAANVEAAQHLTEHRTYWQAIDGFRRRFEQNPTDLRIAHELLDYLNRWWMHHILQVDRGLGVQLNQRGFF